MGEQAGTDTPETTRSDYVAAESFEDFPLSAETQQSIRERGYVRPTPVQAAVLPAILAGRDIIVRSKTGTGKTAAFGIPLVERVDPAARRVQALVLCNTRELALQVSEELSLLGRGRGVQVAAIYGGASMDDQVRALREGAAIVVGTPGRVLDLIERDRLDLSKGQIAVLDEADEMLSQGFYQDVMNILGNLPRGHQTLLFSATVSPGIEEIVRTHLKDPETILLSGDVYTVEGIQNILYFAQDNYPKPRNLLYMLQLENPETAIVFCNTRDDVNLVATVLTRNGYDADKLSGELSQAERERAMGRIKRGEVRFMVATDLAARGIDISDLTHVINYSLPEDPSVYLHRVGRTGRIGKTGTALSLVRGTELVTLTALQKRFGIRFEERKLPTPDEAHRLWTDTHIAELRAVSGTLVYDSFLPLAQELKSRQGGEVLLAFALKYFFTHHRKERAAAERQDEEVRTTQEKQEAHKERLRERRTTRAKPRLEGAADGRREARPGREPPARGGPAKAPASAASEGTPPAQAGDDTAGAPPAEEARPRSRLWVGLGENAGVDEGAVRAALAELSGAAPEKIRSVELRAQHAYVEVDPASVDAFLQANGRTWQDKQVGIEIARPPGRRRRR